MTTDRRPDWLPTGHAFCPGPKEEVRIRTYPGMPGVAQNILTCVHGTYLSKAEAWTAHEHFRPLEASPHIAIVQKYNEEEAAWSRVEQFAKALDHDAVISANGHELRIADLEAVLSVASLHFT